MRKCNETQLLVIKRKCYQPAMVLYAVIPDAEKNKIVSSESSPMVTWFLASGESGEDRQTLKRELIEELGWQWNLLWTSWWVFLLIPWYLLLQSSLSMKLFFPSTKTIGRFLIILLDFMMKQWKELKHWYMRDGRNPAWNWLKYIHDFIQKVL